MSQYLDNEAAEVGNSYSSDEVPLFNPRSRKHGTPPSRRRVVSSDDEEQTPPAKKSVSSSKILEELQKTNDVIKELVSKVKKTDKRVRAMEEQLKAGASSSSSSSSTPKRNRSRDVPDEVRVSRFCLFDANIILYKRELGVVDDMPYSLELPRLPLCTKTNEYIGANSQVSLIKPIIFEFVYTCGLITDMMLASCGFNISCYTIIIAA